ncbi:uncharacterized protein LOC110444372, partial [Mizuhopecten yessoensis]|uniref:uncharacterized protein LOC110444372 n=1 Tax=Mizuhopecten yessoensis TaxID=6573 RepID=UPI000B45A2CC
ETPDILEYWNGVLLFMKELALSEKCAKFPVVIKPFKYFFGNLAEKRLKKTPELITQWMPVFSEMLQKTPSSKCLDSWAFQTAITMAEFWPPQKGLAIPWLTIVKGLLQYPDPDAGRAANYILSKDKFIAIWDWKVR